MKVALDFKRNCIGIELNSDYEGIIKKRIGRLPVLDQAS